MKSQNFVDGKEWNQDEGMVQYLYFPWQGRIWGVWYEEFKQKDN